MRRVVVLGTGTGVGKTHVTAALAEALRHARPGILVTALKPIETGTRVTPTGAPAAGSDAATLERASNGPMLRPHPLVALRDGVSAHLAARRQRRRLDVHAVATWANATPHATPPVTYCQLIETAGGVFSPVTPSKTNFDLALALGAARWVLVAPDALGVLHDLRATLTAMAALGRPPDFVVLSAARPRDASTGTNAAELPRLGLPRPVCTVPRSADAVHALAPLARALLRQRSP